LRVLLIEDSARLQNAVGRALRKSGYAVDVTGDGEDGLFQASSCDYDVVILDLMLPGLDGLSTIGYSPLDQALDGSYRKLRVVARGSEKLTVTTRAGYRATRALAGDK
jgi:CheY-like chemotaxis protein